MDANVGHLFPRALVTRLSPPQPPLLSGRMMSYQGAPVWRWEAVSGWGLFLPASLHPSGRVLSCIKLHFSPQPSNSHPPVRMSRMPWGWGRRWFCFFWGSGGSPGPHQEQAQQSHLVIPAKGELYFNDSFCNASLRLLSSQHNELSSSLSSSMTSRASFKAGKTDIVINVF